MNDPSVFASFRSEILRLLAPLAALAAMAAFAAREIDPSGAAESAYLAVLATAVLLTVGFLARWPAIELGLGATLATAAVWSLPPGPGRGAAVVLVLIATVAVAAGRRLLVPGAGLEGVIPLALALQFLLRGELLFEPTASFRTLVALIALPVAGAAAVALLARRHSVPFALIAGATAILLAPGFNVAATLSLIALAAGDVLAWEDLSWRAKAAAWIVLLAPILWEPGPGLAAAVCALALWRPRIALALAALVSAGLGWLYQTPWEMMARQLAWLPLLLPAALIPERQEIERVLTAVLIAATVPQVPNLATLAAPLALAALALRRNRAVTVPQRVWTGALLGGTALLASYPWLREEPLAEALSLLGWPGPALAAAVAAVFLALAGLGSWMGRGWSEPLRSTRLAGLAAACVALAFLLRLPAPGTELLAPEVPVVIDAGHPVWETGVPQAPLRSVVLESNLANGASLTRGTPVATLRLRDAAGRTVGWTLRAGEDVGEWAARRPDVARTATRPPRAWISWVAGDFFGQRYRCRWRLAQPDRFVQLRIERAPGAPPDLALALYQLEVRR
ncbi:MAG TPA: hypothetical protein VGX68_24735 [Thermoanaerobaculia bacterium]|nr:hypothetical protein [Thermoanaerobaculia bacterium]